MQTRFLPFSLLLLGLAACHSPEPLAEEALPVPTVLHFADRAAYDAQFEIMNVEL